MTRAPGAVIAISSQLARGSVGNRAMVFALERLGFTVWSVPTNVMPHHPGHGPVEAIRFEDDKFARLLQALIEAGRDHKVGGIVSGYFSSPSQVHAVAGLVRELKASQPGLTYLCDPVIGDTGRRYVGEGIAEAIRDELLPLADAATPNAYECAWLVGADGPVNADLTTLARALPPPVVLVTSAPALLRDAIGALLVTKEDAILFEHPRIETPLKGTGDLLAALFFARRLAGCEWAKAAELSLASVSEIIAGSAKTDADELMLAELQESIVDPRTPIHARRMGGVRPTSATR